MPCSGRPEQDPQWCFACASQRAVVTGPPPATRPRRTATRRGGWLGPRAMRYCFLSRPSVAWLLPPNTTSKSPGPRPLTRRSQSRPSRRHGTGCLHAHRQRIPDPRSRRGRWYPLVSLLLICACAVVSGARTITETTEWGQRATTSAQEQLSIRRHLPGRRCAPSHATLIRLLAALDGDALDTAIGAYLAERKHTTIGATAIAAQGGDRGGRQSPVRRRAPAAAPPAPGVRRHPRSHRHAGPAEGGGQD